MLVAGVDGCPGGWILVCAQADHLLSLVAVRVVPTFSEVVDRTRDCTTIGIDVPIGLSDNGRRMADLEARKVLRPLRHNSVFPAPLLAVLGAPTYEEACLISARTHVDRMRTSKQTYFLSEKILEVDRVIDAEIQERIVEVHPEVCFWALNDGKPMPNPKRAPAGEQERLELLSRVFTNDLASFEVPRRAARDDFYDACVAAWSASRFATGRHGTLPEQPPLDSRGLRMEIVY
jgi:predicted RNase H-like nuclease